MNPNVSGSPASRTNAAGSADDGAIGAQTDGSASSGSRAFIEPDRPGARSERARRTDGLPRRARTAGIGAPRPAVPAAHPDGDVRGLMIGLQLDAQAVITDAAEAGLTMQGAATFDPDAATAASRSPAADFAGRRDHQRDRNRAQHRQPVAPRQIFDDEPVVRGAQAVPAPVVQPSLDGIEALRGHLESWIAEGATLESRNRRQLAAEEIMRVYCTNLTTLQLNRMGLDCLPHCMNQLTSVEWLDVEGNFLSYLPALPPPNLQYVYARHNRFERFPHYVPYSVTHIDLSHNRLISIPADLQDGVVRFNVAHNALTHMPYSLPQSLRHARFDHNPIADIPQSVFFLHPDARVELSMQFLSPEARHAARSQAAERATGERRGPNLVFVDVAPYFDDEDDDPAPDRSPPVPALWQWELNEQGDLIPSAPVGTPSHWRNRLGDEPNDNRPHFIRLIDALETSADYAHPGLRQPFCIRVATLLRQLETDRAGRDLCFAIAAEWTRTCEDGVALAFDNMEMALYCAEVERGTLSIAELGRVGGQMMRYEALERFTLALPNAEHMDLTEAALRLRTALIDDLDLPTTCRSMFYVSFAERSCLVTQETIDAARDYVEQETGGETLVDYLASWQPWVTRLALDHPERAAQLAESNEQQKNLLAEQMEQLEDASQQMGSGQYARAAKALADRYNAIGGFDLATRRELTIASLESIVAALSGEADSVASEDEDTLDDEVDRST